MRFLSRSMAQRGGVAVALVGLLATSAGPALAFECRDREDAEAAHLRWLQTRMMVAALSCDGKPYYNTFVQQNRPTLDWSVKRMHAIFARDHRAASDSQYNLFNTRLANEAAAERTRLDLTYCRASEAFMTEVFAQEPTRLAAYATRLAATDGVLPTTCQRQAELAQKP